MTPLPDIEALIVEGRLRAQAVDPVALTAMLEAAQSDLDAAATIVSTSPSWAEAMLYESALRCARVIVLAAGFRIAADRGHLTAIDAADALTGGAHHRRFVRVHRMRRVRHEFMYDVGRAPTDADLTQARRDVAALLKAARRALKDVT